MKKPLASVRYAAFFFARRKPPAGDAQSLLSESTRVARGVSLSWSTACVQDRVCARVCVCAGAGAVSLVHTKRLAPTCEVHIHSIQSHLVDSGHAGEAASLICDDTHFTLRPR